MPKVIRNIGASVRARLQNLSRETGQSFELILTRYALERPRYRLSTSAHAERWNAFLEIENLRHLVSE